jgi:putative membrane-bound dehydrogenase-like protein
MRFFSQRFSVVMGAISALAMLILVARPFHSDSRADDIDSSEQAREQPWPLEKALASIVPKKGFVVEIAAAEPLVADPVAIDFSPDGKMWVAEMPDYYHFTNEEFAPHGSIKVLADRDGDGRYDEASTFCEGLRFPTDVLVWGKGAIVCDAPDVIYFEDADGDGKAETRKVLLTGFETHNAQARVNSLRWGLDNWLYGSCGIFGGKIRTFTGEEFDLGGRDFRFRPDTGEFEAATGSTQQGRARDDWGNWFGCENSSLMDHYPLEDRYLARNPHIAPPSVEVSVPSGGDASQLYPIGELTLFKMSGPPGRPTAACGLEVYRDELLGAEFANNVFVAEPVNQLIHRRILKPRGGTFSGARAADESSSEFLASTDPWFRPVQIRTGLDGCLYVVDMHREVIEHQKFIPEEELRGLNVTAGREQGRIYRVRPTDVSPRASVRWHELDGEELAATIDSPNGPQRDCVQQLLIQRADKMALPGLVKVVRQSSRPAARLQALCTLDGLKALDAEIVVAALADADSAVRRHAIRVSEPLLAAEPSLIDAILGLVDDADPQVQLQLAYTLGTTSDPRVPEALARIVANNSDDPYVLGGVWSSVNASNVVAVTEAMLRQASTGKLTPRLLAPAIGLIAELGDEPDLLTVAKSLQTTAAADDADWQFAAAELLEQARQKSRAVEAIQKLFAPMIVAARNSLEANSGDEPQQLAALRILVANGSQGDELLPLLQRLLEPQNSPAVHRAAIELAASIGTPEAAQALLAPWRAYTSAARSQAFNLMLGSKEMTSLLLDQIDAGKIGPGDLDALQRQRLLTHADESVRSRAAAALAGATDANRDKIVKQYVAEVAQAASESDAGRGRQAFAKHCSGCHRLQDQGFEVGPDLAALTSRSPAALIESIFDPNRALDERYRSYSAQTSDGLSHAGILTAETSTSITLTEQEGKRHTLLRSDLDQFENTGKSLMPEGLERDLTPRDIGDVIAYLRTIGPPAKVIEGNQPILVAAGSDGSLRLLAENGSIFGNDITFEPEHRNIGHWHGQLDHVAWDVEVPAAGEYEVALDSACIDDAAGNGFVVEGGAMPLHGTVAGTGNFESGVGDFHSYQTKTIGRISLAAGPGRIILRPDGPLKSQYLMDFRGLQLVPVSTTASSTESDDATAAITKLLDGLAVGKPEEYERIPKIWESAIAAAKRNEADELVRLLELSLPDKGEPLADWQAVVIGGGVINGVSIVGEWPARRIAELMKDRPDLRAKWDRTILLADAMADNEKVKTGTRYDALRIIALGDWDKYGKKLIGYLQAGVDPELNMGAVSGLSDMENDAVPPALIGSLGHLDETNRKLAIEALVRTPERARRLLDAIERGAVREDLLTSEQLANAKKAAGVGAD